VPLEFFVKFFVVPVVGLLLAVELVGFELGLLLDGLEELGFELDLEALGLAEEPLASIKLMLDALIVEKINVEVKNKLVNFTTINEIVSLNDDFNSLNETQMQFLMELINLNNLVVSVISCANLASDGKEINEQTKRAFQRLKIKLG